MKKSIHSNRLMTLSVIAAGWLSGQSVWAVPLEAWTPFFFRDSWSTNPYFDGGEFADLGVFASPNPNTYPGGPDIGDLTTVTASQNGVVLNIPKLAGTTPAFLNQYGIVGAYNSAFTGPWTITVSNPSTDNTEVVLYTNSIENIEPIPFVRNVSLSGSGTDLVVDWDQPDSDRVDFYTIFISDAATGEYVHIDALPVDQTSYQIPVQFNNGVDSLTIGTDYLMTVEARDFDEVGGESFVVAVSRKWISFTPTEGEINAFLPSVDPNGNFNFDIDVETGTIYYIDPLVAVGYDYLTGEGNPNFASVLLPDVGDGIFDLWLFDQADQLFDSGFDLLAGVEFDFLTNISSLGLDRFRILGIETSAGLDPADVTAFVTGLSFVSAGEFTGQMRPIVENVPEPATLTLFGLGLAGLGLQRRRRAA